MLTNSSILLKTNCPNGYTRLRKFGNLIFLANSKHRFCQQGIEALAPGIQAKSVAKLDIGCTNVFPNSRFHQVFKAHRFLAATTHNRFEVNVLVIKRRHIRRFQRERALLRHNVRIRLLSNRFSACAFCARFQVIRIAARYFMG